MNINEADYRDIPETLFKSRVLMLMQEITPEVAEDLISKLAVLDSVSEDSIDMYINSPGGDVIAGLAIYDFIRTIRSPVNTVCIGECASMAAILLAAGDERYAFENSEIMIHQPSGEIAGKSTEITEYSENIKKSRHKLAKLLSKHTKKSVKQILKDIDNDYWMSAKEAKNYGIIDKVILAKKGNK